MKDLDPYIESLIEYMVDQGLEIDEKPTVEFIEDEDNAADIFGRTAYYDPAKKHLAVYVTGRHPKDILRSVAHEMIHVEQDGEGKLDGVTTSKITDSDELKEIEREAYERGNIMFRSWTEFYRNKDTIELSEGEKIDLYMILERKTKKGDPYGLNAYARELALLREDFKPWNIYLDMDGVIANFEQRFVELTGDTPEEFERINGKDSFWGKIDKEFKITFWVGIRPMPGAKELIDLVAPYGFDILTSPSEKKESYIGKYLWVQKHRDTLFNGRPPKVFFKKAKDKHKVKEVLSRWDLLIDDRIDTVERWRKAGGTAIHYKNFEQVMGELEHLGV